MSRDRFEKIVDALNDGECPCCHGKWPGPDATECDGCGYELEEEEDV